MLVEFDSSESENDDSNDGLSEGNNTPAMPKH